MAKKGISAYPEYDKSGRWMLVIEKQRGKLTLEEIKEAAREHEWDFYLLVLDCFHDPADDEQYAAMPDRKGDRVELYRTDLLFEEGER